MADTGGIAALMKALNETPSLGSGLKSGGVSKAGGISRSGGIAATKSVGAPATSFSQSIRTASAPAKLPRVLGAEGKGYDPKAPRGSYIDVVV